MVMPDDIPNLATDAQPENPFVQYADILRSDYGAAIDIQNLVMHLFNNNNPVDMGSVIRRDERHAVAALDMLFWYAEYGENCQVFMSVARALVEKKLG